MSGSVLYTDGVSRVRIPPESKEGLTPKTDPQHINLRGELLAPTLQDWRGANAVELAAMMQQHYVDKALGETK